MLALIVRLFRLCCGLILAALVLQWLVYPARADEVADVKYALEDAAMQHRIALRTLETSGQQETAAAVQRFRQSWQQVVESYGALPAGVAGDTRIPAVFVDIDLRIIGVLLTIDLGNRDAARSGLEAIAGLMAELGSGPTRPAR